MEFNYHLEIGGEQIFEGGFTADLSENDPGAAIFEEASPQSVADFGLQQLRAAAMAVALAWVAGKGYSFEDLDFLVQDAADLDGDMEIGADEEEYYNTLFSFVGEALIALGGDQDNVQTFIDSEDSEAGAKLGSFLSEKIDGNNVNDGDLINNYAVGDTPILESTVKAIRGGQLTFITKKVRRRKLNAAQRMALKGARLKANTSAAKKARKHSMRLRAKMGLK
jgi:hypothetical protein